MNRSEFPIAPVSLRTFPALAQGCAVTACKDALRVRNPQSAIRNPQSRWGFTLLELLVVLVIISFMSALVVPKIAGSMVNLKLKTASKRVSAALRYARSNAVSGKRTYAAAFDFDKNRLSIFTSPIDGGENDEEPVEDEERSASRPRVYDLPEGIRVEKGVAGDEEVDSGLFQILFFPNGGSSGGHVILANNRGRSYRIGIDFITGIVEVRD